MSRRGLENLGDSIRSDVYDRLEKNFSAAGINFHEYRRPRNSSNDMPWNTQMDIVGGGMNPGTQGGTAREIPPEYNNPPPAKASRIGKTLKKPAGNVPGGEANDPVGESNAPADGIQKDIAPPGPLPDDPSESPLTINKNTAHLKSMGEAVDRWDAQIIDAANKHGVPPEQLKAMVWIETGGAGNPDAVQINPTHGNTYGLTQINPIYWAADAAQLGYDLDTVEGQLGMGAYILKIGYDTTGSWDGASSWYFNPSGTGDSVNGTSNNQYISKLHELMGY
jgi:hypothetical protein